jgi:hypothetical protein
VHFDDNARGVSNLREGSKILTLLFGPRLVCAARSYISDARGSMEFSEVRVKPSRSRRRLT